MKSIYPAVSVLQITDLHILSQQGGQLLGVDTEQTFHEVVDKALSDNPKIDLILLTGDLTQEPKPSSYHKILKKLTSLAVPCLCLPGNHDDLQMMQRILNFHNVSSQKQIKLNGWQILCLNSLVPGSDGGHLSSGELRFMEQCLRDEAETPTLIAVHHHCLKTDSEWMDTMMIDNASEFLAVAAEHANVKAIICGHIHQTLEKSFASIQILGTPSTCFQFKPDSQFFVLDDTPPGYRMIALNSDGSVESSVNYLPEKSAGLQFGSRY